MCAPQAPGRAVRLVPRLNPLQAGRRLPVILDGNLNALRATTVSEDRPIGDPEKLRDFKKVAEVVFDSKVPALEGETLKWQRLPK